MEDYGTEVRLLAVTGLMGPEWYGWTEADTKPQELLIEYAGRLCYDAEDKTGTRPGWIQDRIKDGHESILEHASATFWIKASRVFTHELVRHRIASYSQRSQRYVNESAPGYITPPELEEARERLLGTVASYPKDIFTSVIERCWDAYAILLKQGIPKEIARYVLPNACETQIVVTMNFRELRHFISLRTSLKALPEMREVANKVKIICKGIAPEVFENV